ncbi:hypothetical protein [Yinghuangia seranimata]|uniref:hypothetical protein n=1 Tax=Yinghuangia seranimata TaxID=408067 RepID=UPI00248B7120|nr:hypothetical protein [Yinghuangia seranimata]MDI2124834.1 hypothetical protein [Yinghuangia seranimata]
MHEMRLHTGSDAQPRAWHITPTGAVTPLCGLPIEPAVTTAQDDGADAPPCAECLAAYGNLLAAGPAPSGT